jgi:Mce-associated membrane protein
MMPATGGKTLMPDSPALAESAAGAADQRSAADPDADEATSDETATEEAATEADQPGSRPRRLRIARVVAFGGLPAMALLLAVGAGVLKWQDATVRDSDTARVASVQAAKDSTVVMLSYQPDTVEKDLVAARDKLTGAFRDSYSSLTNDVVIPGAKQRHISAVASVPAAASVSASANDAVVLVFVNQTAIVGNDAPTSTASTVRVTLAKVDGRWLVSQFDPI